MKKYKIIAIISLTINFVLAFFLIKNLNQKEIKLNHIDFLSKNEDLSNPYNFKKIFIEKNDSIYKAVFNNSYKNLPVQAFLLSCTYYLIKKDNNQKKDIKIISSKLKRIYGKSPIINFQR
ncbi:MAG TPA: hypothetical protein VN704_12925 [Verrucomicrobiae bacterium]|nr:hypothetical protein [Verrucomicrobiae bacterium]